MTDNLGDEKEWSSLIISGLRLQFIHLVGGNSGRVSDWGRTLESDYGFYVKYFVKKDGK